MTQEATLKKAADILRNTRHAVALTGAGVSVASGIPAFRGSQGLWEKWDPRIFEISFFRQDPVQGWTLLLELDKLMMAARPNEGHNALAELERMGIVTAVITQNIDGLHQEAGSRDVVEFHGSSRRMRCMQCGRTWAREEISLDSLPPRCGCSGLIKPDVVFFGEAIPEQAGISAYGACNACEVMLVVGTSAVVAPASHLPVIAKQAGAKIIEINMEPSALGSLSDFVILGEASAILPQLVEAVKKPA
ncbi:MAG: NAD-dependent deacylase [Desulfarculales bacterium]|jgi:NAD-dependent deacetylase|nr:NAD-dependent deacylase [Desulfarculales bacterium]